MTTASPQRGFRVREGLLVLVAVSLALLAAEVAYRGFRVYQRAFHALPPDEEAPSFGVYNPPPWEFDDQFGFGYVPSLDWWTANIRDGAFKQCNFQPRNNERGNIGDIEGDYDAASLKILVFGDSFAAMNPGWEGRTWPNWLQRKLAERTGRSVHVVNFGRDSYGVLQMLDLAGARVPEWKPDLALIVFITNDLTRPRTWRIVKNLRGYSRMIVSSEASEAADPRTSHTNEGAILSEQVTRAWCQRMGQAWERGDEDTLRNDPVVRGLVTQFNTIRRENVPKTLPIDHTSLRVSFLYNRIRYGYPYRGMQEFEDHWRGGATPVWDFSEDARFVRAVASLKASGTPVLLIHMPVYPEIRAREEYIFGYTTDGDQERALLASLERLAGQSVIPLLPHMDLPLENPLDYVVSAEDWHPNAKGIVFYAEAVSRALLDRDLL